MLTVPVLVISYFPVDDQGWIDLSVTTDVTGPYAEIRQRTIDYTQQLASVLERGSCFRAYRKPAAPPSLRYEIVGNFEYREALPLSGKIGASGNPFPDYRALLERVDIDYWVRQRQVAEVWIWAYHGAQIELWESNMASPWGDISNSDRDPDDLPVLDRTYTVYHYNYQRGVSEATENHMHQFEAVFRQLDPELFWDRFVGPTGGGRCGWSHIPPNGQCDYDWANRQYVWTDIEDWQPDGSGEKQWLNCDRWNGHSLDWFIHWMQSIPGLHNGLRFRGRDLNNWWRFIGEFDAMLRAGQGLVL